ncbi:MAG: haloacid dehalogenase type II [Dehalococcoidia bacterium]
MPRDLSQIRALTFDVGGTVFDWHSTIRDEVIRLATARGMDVDAPKFANEWRAKMFELLGQVRRAELPWMNADALHRMALDEIAPKQPGFQLSAGQRDELNTVWHRLRAWPDFAGALERLRPRYTVVVLTVLSWSLVVDSSKHNGLSWDGILSCEFLGHYKPDREAYESSVSMLGLQPSQVMMVAAHPSDLRASAVAGLATAYVPRPGERGDPTVPDRSPIPEFDVSARDFTDLANKLVG